MTNQNLFTKTLALYEKDSYHPALTIMGLVSLFWISIQRAEELLIELDEFLDTRHAEMIEFSNE